MKLLGKLPPLGEPAKIKLVAEDCEQRRGKSDTGADPFSNCFNKKTPPPPTPSPLPPPPPPPSAEDMWHAYNLVRPGDAVTASTFRKVAAPPGAGGVGGPGASDRVKITLTLAVASTEYDPDAPSLRVGGANTTECDAVRLGAHHTLEIAPGRAFSLFKPAWDAADRERVRTATDVAATADLAVLLVSDGLANLVLVGAATSRVVAHVEHALPRKKGAAVAGYDKAVAAFHDKCVAAVVRHVDWDVVKCLLVAGPGFAKDGVRAALGEAAVKQELR